MDPTRLGFANVVGNVVGPVLGLVHRLVVSSSWTSRR
jgi:hypothetical protein